MLFNPGITQEFYDTLNAYFPDSKTDKALRRFVMYLAFGNWFNWGERKLSLSQQVCAIIEGREAVEKLSKGKYVAYHLLDRVQETILPDFRHSDYDKGVSRTLYNDGFSSSFRNAIALERATLIDSSVPTVHYFTGKPISKVQKTMQNRATLELARRLELAERLTEEVSPILPLQREYIDYLNALPSNAFTIIVNENYDSALAVARALPPGQGRDQTLDMLAAIRIQPKPVYAARKASVRLFAVGPSMTHLKKSVRKALTKGWVEFDLQNAHLAIIAKDWQIPELAEVLSEGSFWTYLKSFVDIDKHKAEIKTAIYSLVYGAAKQTIRSAMGSELAKVFFKIPVIKAIYEARKKELTRLQVDDSAALDIFGRKISTKIHNPRSVLSQKAQAVELELMRPVLRLSTKDAEACMMTVYQFDGFSLRIKDQREITKHAEHFKAEIDAHIKSLGYPTQVTYEVLS